MGRGRRRQTAKTGDKGLYKKRELANRETHAKNAADNDDDPMYDEVDRFHNQQDFVKFQENEESESENEIDKQEAVMDLAIGGESDEDGDEDEEDSSDDDDNDNQKKAHQAHAESESDSEGTALSSDDDDDDDNKEARQARMKNIRNWGRDKKDYYHGDTADLEIGQDVEDAFVEEEAAKEILAARYAEMKEEDFLLSDDDEEEGAAAADDKAHEMMLQKVDWKTKSRSEKTKFLDRKHPELLPLVSHFSEMLQDFKNQTNVVVQALLEGEEGTAQVRVFKVETTLLAPMIGLGRDSTRVFDVWVR